MDTTPLELKNNSEFISESTDSEPSYTIVSSQELLEEANIPLIPCNSLRKMGTNRKYVQFIFRIKK